jgi:predicted nuclease of predicted toxin-antitoxin system
MKILLDECVPKDVKRFLPKHEVRNVIECGWSAPRSRNK